MGICAAKQYGDNKGQRHGNQQPEQDRFCGSRRTGFLHGFGDRLRRCACMLHRHPENAAAKIIMEKACDKPRAAAYGMCAPDQRGTDKHKAKSVQDPACSQGKDHAECADDRAQNVMRQPRFASGFPDIDLTDGKQQQIKRCGDKSVCIDKHIAHEQESAQQHDPCKNSIIGSDLPYLFFGFDIYDRRCSRYGLWFC